MMTIPASSGVRDTDPSSVGNMEGAFFRGKRELLDWINKTFDMDVSKVELCASGAIFCQIVDALYPNKVRSNHTTVKYTQEVRRIALGVHTLKGGSSANSKFKSQPNNFFFLTYRPR
eukprot:GHVT01105027.1.p3 GENE.GHVT01105027.1~~GHVT01105027.1.p3  ORF type:complete len:117 (-),score=9.23 GHVT01105027.1:1541-1891(-)